MNFETYQLDKRLDSFNYQQTQADILPILERGSNVVLDMTACRYISRKLCLVGISEEVKDIMDVTGFNTFFETFSTMEECLEKMKE